MVIPLLTTASVSARLAMDWGLQEPAVTVLLGGMNSQTWLVTLGEARWVVKAVPSAAQPHFAGGLAVAALVEATGVPAGAPVPTRDGRSTVRIDGHTLALLTFVEGTQLSGQTPRDQGLIGATLGRVHRALAGTDMPEAERFHWIDLAATHLRVRDWVRPAVARALAEWDAIDPGSFNHGLLHSDPAPEAFRFDASSGVCGLIDWDRVLVGPLLYDLASAVMYVGGPSRGQALVAAYLAGGPMSGAEIERGLRAALRLRWAVQADYFARRGATDDRTGIDGPAENEKGLEDAHRALLVED